MRLKTQAAASAARVPSRYIASMVRPCRPIPPQTVIAGTKAPIRRVYTGSRAEQLISGTTMMVARRSFGSSMVRVAMMPGTAQA